jgi:hypothetical protein
LKTKSCPCTKSLLGLIVWMYWRPHAAQNHKGRPPPTGSAIHHWFSRIGIILQFDLLQLYLTDTVSEIIGMKSAPATIAKSSCDGSAFATIFSTFVAYRSMAFLSRPFAMVMRVAFKSSAVVLPRASAGTIG